MVQNTRSGSRIGTAVDEHREGLVVGTAGVRRFGLRSTHDHHATPNAFPLALRVPQSLGSSPSLSTAMLLLLVGQLRALHAPTTLPNS